MPFFRIIRLKFGRRFGCLWAISLSAVGTSHAQLDPEPRKLEELRNARVPIRSL